MLVINLTQDQIDALSGGRNQLQRMADDGKPGAMFAQIYGDHMRVGIMSHDAMLALYEANGTPDEKRREHRTAYDLTPNAGVTGAKRPR